MSRIRIGIVGLGANTRLRHVPGFRACMDVEIVGVCNRRPQSTQNAAQEFNIPKTFDQWQKLVADPDIDAVLIGTWPYLHCDIVIAALEAGKHVLTEARMACNAGEAHRMLHAAQQHPDRVAQIVPSPFGLQIHQAVKDLLVKDFIGELREVVVLGSDASYSDPSTPLHWRQSEEFSGVNMLLLGILHETLIRWVPNPIRVQAQRHTFTPERPDLGTGKLGKVGTPDSLHVLTELTTGARGIYHLSSVLHHGPTPQIHLYGREGTLKCLFGSKEQLFGGRQNDLTLREIPVPDENRGRWRVEEEFIDAIRGKGTIEFTDFETGVRYMEFTDAVAKSAHRGQVLDVRPAI